MATLSAQLAEEYESAVPDSLALVSLIVEARQVVNTALAAAVALAREQRRPWSAIGDAAGCSPQNAFQRWHDTSK